MVWWQGILIFLASVAAGSIVGLLPAYVILRIQKRPWPFSRARRGVPVAQARGESTSQAGVDSASHERDAEAESGRESQEATVVEERIGSSAQRNREDIESVKEKRETTLVEERVGAITEWSQEDAESISEKREATLVEERVGAITQWSQKDAESISEKRKATLAEERVGAITQWSQRDAESISEKQEPVEGEEQVKSRMPNILREVETNLAIAAAPWTGRLLPFHTDVWHAGCGEVNSLPANCQHELAEAYADMHLANRIVWLATDMGRRSGDLDESYQQICARITERLNRVNQAV